MRKLLTAGLIAASAAGLAACGTTSVHASSTTPTSTTPTTTAPAPAPPNASAITARLQAAGLPMPKGVDIYTAATDPNNLLGRPGEYTSKTEWVDSRYALDPDAEVSVEVFPDAKLAAKRAAYVQSFMGGILGTEYDYQAGPVLLRVSGKLTPVQAAQYGAAIDAKLLPPAS